MLLFCKYNYEAIRIGQFEWVFESRVRIPPGVRSNRDKTWKLPTLQKSEGSAIRKGKGWAARPSTRLTNAGSVA